jgi:CRISPR/Cas system-associated exonuclease Cas4 (RecB family)
VFRHGITAVPASAIAEQYYCEQKVELEYIRGRVETESKREGQEFHEQLIKMRKVALKGIVEGIKHKKLFVASLPIVASFSQLVLVGIPDAVVFVRGVPTLLIELKTTRGDTSRLWDDQLVQARTYGLILEEMGFDCSKLKLVIPRIRRTPQQLSRWKDVFLRSVIQDVLKAEPPQTLKRSEFTIHVIKYSRAHATADVKWAEAYWVSSRQPIPAGNAAKCRNCELMKSCSHISAGKTRSPFSSKTRKE